MTIGASNTGVLEQAVQEVRAALVVHLEMLMGNEREGRTNVFFASSARNDSMIVSRVAFGSTTVGNVGVSLLIVTYANWRLVHF